MIQLVEVMANELSMIQLLLIWMCGGGKSGCGCSRGGRVAAGIESDRCMGGWPEKYRFLGGGLFTESQRE